MTCRPNDLPPAGPVSVVDFGGVAFLPGPIFAHQFLPTSEQACAVKLNEKFDVSLWSVLCFIGLVVVLSVAATLTIAGADERNVSDAIATKLSKEAALDASERQELSDLRTKVADDAQAVADEKAATEREV